MRALAGPLLASLLLAGAPVPASAADDWRQLTVAAPGALEALRRIGNGIYLDLRRSPAGGGPTRYHRLYLSRGDLVLEAMPYFLVAPEERRPDMLPDGLIFRGERNIREAWLAGPTGRYRHGALGDAIEATTLKAVDQIGLQASFELDEDSVFEDLYPRLVDVDGDGFDEILVVRSYRDRGAAVAVFEMAHGTLRLRAESAPIGRPRRWLNPVGVAELDGDDAPEIAVVETPHIGGILKIYQLGPEGLTPEAEQAGFSNHVIGSRELGMGLLADLDRDGLFEIVLPTADRKSLEILSFAAGQLHSLATVPHDRPIDSALHGLDLDGDGRPELIYALDDGTVVVLTR